VTTSAVRKLGVTIGFIAISTSGCGGSGGQDGFVKTSSVLAAFRAAGFASPFRGSNVAGMRALVKKVGLPPSSAAHALDEDLLSTRDGRFPFTSLAAVRLSSSKFAARTYRLWGVDAMRRTVAQARAQPALYKGFFPPGFRVSMLRTARVCNVVLWSYNPRNSRVLDRRLENVVARLKEAC